MYRLYDFGSKVKQYLCIKGFVKYAVGTGDLACGDAENLSCETETILPDAFIFHRLPILFLRNSRQRTSGSTYHVGAVAVRLFLEIITCSYESR